MDIYATAFRCSDYQDWFPKFPVGALQVSMIQWQSSHCYMWDISVMFGLVLWGLMHHAFECVTFAIRKLS